MFIHCALFSIIGPRSSQSHQAPALPSFLAKNFMNTVETLSNDHQWDRPALCIVEGCPLKGVYQSQTKNYVRLAFAHLNIRLHIPHIYMYIYITPTCTLHLHVNVHVDVHPHVPYIYNVYLHLHTHLQLSYIEHVHRIYIVHLHLNYT